MLRQAIAGAVAGSGGGNVTVQVFLPDGSEFKNIVAKVIETDPNTQQQVRRVAKAA
jgi:hypothetical protein